MTWIFVRGEEALRYDISRDRATGRYRIAVTGPHGSGPVEDVDEPSVLIERCMDFMNALRSEGWRLKS